MNATAALPASRRRARILVAEDNITNQQVAVGILKKLGFSAEAVADGQEALRALAEIPYDLVLMDVRMPGMDGLEATRLIRSPHSPVRNHAIPIIAMTAHALARDRDQCLAAGMNDYLSKPVEPVALAQALDKWLSQAHDDSTTTPAVAVSNQSAKTMTTSDAIAVPIFDRVTFLSLMMGDENLLKVVQEAFLEDMPKQIEQLQKLVAQGDTKQSGAQAHKIKGAAANVGGKTLREVASAMEVAGKTGNQKILETRLPELVEQFQLLKTAMEK